MSPRHRAYFPINSRSDANSTIACPSQICGSVLLESGPCGRVIQRLLLTSDTWLLILRI